MTGSAVEPAWYWIKKIEGNVIHLLIRWNAKEIAVDDDEHGSHTEYEYDENAIIVSLPDGVRTLDELSAWITESEKTFLDAAKATVDKIAPTATEDVRTTKISDVREKLKETKPIVAVR